MVVANGHELAGMIDRWLLEMQISRPLVGGRDNKVAALLNDHHI